MGPSVCSAEIYKIAYEVGFQVAKHGAILICGGGTGVMEASAKGAKEADGITIGVLSGESAAEANPYIDVPIVTGMGNARNVINILTSHAVIAIDGASGTLSEIALALRCHIPVVGLKTWKLTQPDGQLPEINLVETAAQAVSVALALMLREDIRFTIDD
jgi:uncharacterized protein (TIGR00725 family)